jgi:hypothetical protein
MAAPQIVPLPPFFQMSDGMHVVVTAIDASTGALVTGVVVSDVSIDVDTDESVPPIAAPNPVQGAYTTGGELV